MYVKRLSNTAWNVQLEKSVVDNESIMKMAHYSFQSPSRELHAVVSSKRADRARNEAERPIGEMNRNCTETDPVNEVKAVKATKMSKKAHLFTQSTSCG